MFRVRGCEGHVSASKGSAGIAGESGFVWG